MVANNFIFRVSSLCQLISCSFYYNFNGQNRGNLEDISRTHYKRVHTLITKNFGRFNFRTKVCPEIKTSEIFSVRIQKASEIFGGHILIYLSSETIFCLSCQSMREGGGGKMRVGIKLLDIRLQLDRVLESLSSGQSTVRPILVSDGDGFWGKIRVKSQFYVFHFCPKFCPKLSENTIFLSEN